MDSTIHSLKCLILSHHSLIVMETMEEDRVSNLLSALCSAQDWTLFDWSLASGLRNRNSGQSLVPPGNLMEALLRIQDIALPSIFWFQDISAQLADPLKCRFFREMLQDFQSGDYPRAILLTGDRVELDSSLRSFASHLPLQLPGREELEKILVHTVRGLRERMDFKIHLSSREKDELVSAMLGLTANQARQNVAFSIVEDGRLCSRDIAALKRKRAEALSDGGLLEYCPVEDNDFQLGGFDRLHDWLRRAEIGFSPEAAACNLRPPRGIMLVGVQGCGKSLAAKSIARQWRLPLLKLDAGRLFDKYVGESEKNLRKALDLAESLAPCVLWMDEVEKGFATGSGDSADGGTGRRLLATLLTWMQENRKPVFLVGTANDLQALPPEFLRKGRFDETFFVDLPDAEERRVIFQIHLRLRNQDPAAFDLHRLVQRSESFSGAEIEQAVISALYESLYRKEALSTEVLERELLATVPLAVSRHEEIEQFRLHARKRFVPVTSRGAGKNGLIPASCEATFGDH